MTKIFDDPGLRFLFSTRSAVPDILKEDGSPFFGEGYKFQSGKDDIIRKAAAVAGAPSEYGGRRLKPLFREAP